MGMKKATSLVIGAFLAAIAVCFVSYAAGHPEASFPWSNRITFMIYGVYVWLLLKFLVDIPFEEFFSTNSRLTFKFLYPLY